MIYPFLLASELLVQPENLLADNADLRRSGVLVKISHQPFGSSDEYCRSAKYHLLNPFPNVFESLADCEADAPDVGRIADDCRQPTNGTITD